MTSKKILIAAIVIVLIMLGAGLYFLFSSPGSAPGQTGIGQIGTLPPAGNQNNSSSSAGGIAPANSTNLGKNFGVISNQPAISYFVDANNDAITVQPDGEIDEITNGQTSVLNSLLIQNIIGASFSYDGSRILVTFGDPSNPQASVFDVGAKTWTPMAAGRLSPSWSPSDYRVAYATENSNGTETFSTFDASKPKSASVPLITLHVQDLLLAWAGKNQLAFETKPNSAVAGSAWLFNIQTKSLTPIAIETPGLETLWSDTILDAAQPVGLQFSADSAALGGNLKLVSLSGNTLQNLTFITLPSKCGFASTTSAEAIPATSTPYLFCAVPRDQSDLAFNHLPDDYNQMKLFTSDDIYRINLSNGAINTVFNDQTQNLDASDLAVFNNTLFFLNRYDEKLYAITLQ